jgi:tRNA-specific 2-thiouridylase
MYVQGKDALTNTVTLCSDTAELCADKLTARDFNWIAIAPPAVGEQVRCMARIRYNQREQAATAIVRDDGTVHVTFDEPQRAIARGQAVVLYDDVVVIGGGTVDN